MGKLSATLHKPLEKQMNIMEKMRYMPLEGDVLLYNDGTYMEIIEYKKGTDVKVKWHSAGAEPSEIKKHIPELRTELISGKLHLCRKEEGNEDG